MNTKSILVSILMIGVVAMAAGAGTMAYFSDVETSGANTFTAGTIDIEIDDENPWVSGEWTFGDVKPCETKWINFTITNVGQNPVVLWKHVEVTDEGQGTSSEPEEDAEGGTPKYDISTKIIYDMIVGTDVIFSDEDGVTLDDVECMWMPIGTILNPGENLDVSQSYHLAPETGNEYQGDTCTFAIDIYGEQRLGNGPTQVSNKLFLDDKTGEPDWYFNPNGKWGILTWGSTGELVAQGLTASTGYSLITYTDPWSGSCQIIAFGTSDTNGKLSLSGFTMPSSYEGKIWLVLSNDVAAGGMTLWNPTEYLYESNKVTTV